jgi:hypothetical protein
VVTVGFTEIEFEVAPVLQAKTVPPEADRTAFCPLQIPMGPETEATAVLPSVTVTTPTTVPQELVELTEYVVVAVGETMIEEDEDPVFQT